MHFARQFGKPVESIFLPQFPQPELLSGITENTVIQGLCNTDVRIPDSRERSWGKNGQKRLLTCVDRRTISVSRRLATAVNGRRRSGLRRDSFFPLPSQHLAASLEAI